MKEKYFNKKAILKRAEPLINREYHDIFDYIQTNMNGKFIKSNSPEPIEDHCRLCSSQTRRLGCQDIYHFPQFDGAALILDYDLVHQNGSDINDSELDNKWAENITILVANHDGPIYHFLNDHLFGGSPETEKKVRTALESKLKEVFGPFGKSPLRFDDQLNPILKRRLMTN